MNSEITDIDAYIYRVVAYFLQYPTEEWASDLPVLEQIIERIPEPTAQPLFQFLDWARQVGQFQVEQTYVETFDQRRRCCLELSYYSTGDTRQRGIALSIFRDLYASVGWELTGENLPDYLPYLLELAAATQGEDRDLVEAFLASHREGIEVLTKALTELDSPWALVMEALQTRLPDVDPKVEQQIRKLIKTGPPSETVGRDTGGQDSRTVLLASASALAVTITSKTRNIDKKRGTNQ